MTRVVPFVTTILALAACAAPQPVATRGTVPMPTDTSRPSPDPRVGLRAGWMDAAEVAWNLRLVSNTPRPASMVDPEDPGAFGFLNSDLAFTGTHVIQGNFHGLQVWNVSDPRNPALVTAYVCPGAQNDVSVYRNLLFVSVEAPSGRVDCGTQGVSDTVSAERMVGIRVFDISDLARPRLVTNVQTCRGSHTHTVVTSPRDTANVYVYVSGSAPVRSPSELAGCVAAPPHEDPASALFRIEVIQVPLATPERARIVSRPRIFAGLVEPPTHGPAAEDAERSARIAAAARARGAFTATVNGLEVVLPPGFINPMLDSIVGARQGSGAPTAADSAALRGSIQVIVDRIVSGPPGPGGVSPGPTQCHDITAYPAIGLAGGACGGYGLLLDIGDVTNPRRIDEVADSNFAFWHSATFNNDGTKVLFTDEWGGGLQPRCRESDRPEWGANAIFTLRDRSMRFASYYKLPAPQTRQENCVAHNGSLIPVPGRDIMVQGWYQGGVSVIDWTDAAHPVEIAYHDRGPVDSTRLVGAGSWSAYWYNGYIYSSEIARGLDVFELVPSGWLSPNEIAAAKLVRFDVFNAQHQPQLVWPAHVAVAQAYLDQLARHQGLARDRIAAARAELASAERLTGAERRGALRSLAAQLERDAVGAVDPAKVRLVVETVRAMAQR